MKLTRSQLRDRLLWVAKNVDSRDGYSGPIDGDDQDVEGFGDILQIACQFTEHSVHEDILEHVGFSLWNERHDRVFSAMDIIIADWDHYTPPYRMYNRILDLFNRM